MDAYSMFWDEIRRCNDRAKLEKRRDKLAFLAKRGVAEWRERDELSSINRRLAEMDWEEREALANPDPNDRGHDPCDGAV